MGRRCGASGFRRERGKGGGGFALAENEDEGLVMCGVRIIRGIVIYSESNDVIVVT